MPFANLNSGKVYFEIYGSELDLSQDVVIEKPTIVCLHGGTGQLDHTYEVPFWKRLADKAQIIFIDYLGVGRSSRTRPTLWHPRQWAKDIYQFCRQLELNKPFLAGDSVGGQVAMLAGAHYQGFFAGLILINTETCLIPKEIEEAFRKKGGEKAATIFAKLIDNPDEQTVADYMQYCSPLCSKPTNNFRHCTVVNESLLKEYNQNILYTLDLSEEAKTITDKVLYLASDSNPFHNLAAIERSIKAFNPDILTYEVISNTGLLQIDAPDVLQQKVEEFVSINSMKQTEVSPLIYPETWVKGMLKTVNKMGITTLELAPPAQDFVDYAYDCKYPVVDIGCGYGVSSLAALKAGAKVIAMDLAIEHLQVLEKNTPLALKNNLTLRTSRFPEEFDLPDSSIDAVHASMILHFLSGEQILAGLKKIYACLRPGGKLFVANMSPYLGLYDYVELSEEYNNRLVNNEKWPGYIDQIRFAREPWKNQLPPYAYFFKIEDAVKIISRAGFEVEKVYYYTLNSIPDEYKTNGKEYVGLTAIK